MSGPYWLPLAKEMRAAGATYAEIGARVGRSAPTVHLALHPGKRRQAEFRPKQPLTPEQRRRDRIRADARAEAKATGEDLETICTRWGVPRIDRSRAWDAAREVAL